METRLRHENFRLQQSSVMVRRSHVSMEFIGVATGNGHCANDKLVTIRHNACDRALGTRMTERAMTEMCARYRDFVATEISLSQHTRTVTPKKKKKKKDPWYFGALHV